jgi:hypothetical protein
MYVVDYEKDKDFGRIEIIEQDSIFPDEYLAAMQAIELEREGFNTKILRID